MVSLILHLFLSTSPVELSELLRDWLHSVWGAYGGRVSIDTGLSRCAVPERRPVLRCGREALAPGPSPQPLNSALVQEVAHILA